MVPCAPCVVTKAPMAGQVCTGCHPCPGAYHPELLSGPAVHVVPGSQLIHPADGKQKFVTLSHMHVVLHMPCRAPSPCMSSAGSLACKPCRLSGVALVWAMVHKFESIVACLVEMAHLLAQHLLGVDKDCCASDNSISGILRCWPSNHTMHAQ